jgi:hypothetical protein
MDQPKGLGHRTWRARGLHLSRRQCTLGDLGHCSGTSRGLLDSSRGLGCVWRGDWAFLKQSARPHGVQLVDGCIAGALVDTGVLAEAPADRGSYARIAILRPNDGDTVDFEAGYIRHLAWYRRAQDAWVWYGWSIWAGERQRWFVYASFGHSAAELDNPVSPAEDERDNVSNVAPHCQYLGNALYKYLPLLSRGTGEPQPTARLELTTVDLVPGTEKAFEAAPSVHRSILQDETLWYRMVSGGTVPRYVRLRPRASLSGIVDDMWENALPDKVSHSIARTTVEILTLRPTMSYGLSLARE